MRVRFVIQGLLWTCTLAVAGCGAGPSSEWVLLSEDSEGVPTFIDAESVRLNDDGVAVYKRAVGDSLAPDRVEFLQALDCVDLRWVFLTLDETRLDSIAGEPLDPETWPLLALTPANKALLDAVCPGFPPPRWIRVLRRETDEPGNLKEVWVDRESITGPTQDSVRTEIEDLGLAEEILRSWSRWEDASPDSGYVMVQADVACDLGVLRYLESNRYSNEGELVRQSETTDFWYNMFRGSFEREVFTAVCEMGDFFPIASNEPTPGTSPEGG